MVVEEASAFKHSTRNKDNFLTSRCSWIKGAPHKVKRQNKTTMNSVIKKSDNVPCPEDHMGRVGLGS